MVTQTAPGPLPGRCGAGGGLCAAHPARSLCVRSAGLHAAARGLLGATALHVLPDAAEGTRVPAEEQAAHGGVRLQRLLQCQRRRTRSRPAPRPAPQAAAAGKWGAPHEWPGMLGLLSCSHLPPQEWLLLQSRPLQLGLACTQNVCFLCRQSFFFLSLFCGSNIDLPERRESVRAQGRVCVEPSVASIYIVGLTAQPVAPLCRGWPSEDQLCGSGVADTEPLCVSGRHTLPPLKPLLCQDAM